MEPAFFNYSNFIHGVKWVTGFDTVDWGGGGEWIILWA